MVMGPVLTGKRKYHLIQPLVVNKYYLTTQAFKACFFFFAEARLQLDLIFVCTLFRFSGRGPRDEPARHDGGPVPRVGPHHERRPGGQQGPSDFFSLVSLRTVQLLQECPRRCPQITGKFKLHTQTFHRHMRS